MDFSDLYNDKEDSDFNIQLHTGTIYTHRIILKKASKKLHEMISRVPHIATFFRFPDRYDDKTIMIAIAFAYGNYLPELNAIMTAARQSSDSENIDPKLLDLLHFSQYLELNSLFETLTSCISASTSPVKLIDLGTELKSAQLVKIGISQYYNRTRGEHAVESTLIYTFRKLSLDTYKAMRVKWLDLYYPQFELFKIDCHYCYAVGDRIADTPLEMLITDINFSYFTPKQLQECLDFPIVKASPMIKYFITQLRLTQENSWMNQL